MNYLFFDIECCDGEHICEFGYVITDTHFNIIKKEDITINPEHEFNLTGRPGGRDLYLCYPESVYYNSYKFPYYYDKIKKIIEQENQIIIGHAISNDAGFIRTACKEYKLSPINFEFADSQKMYSEYFNIKKSISLEEAGDTLKIEAPKYLHKSDDDSELTMLFVKALCDNLDCSLKELIELCPSCVGSSKNFNICYNVESLPKILEYAKTYPEKISQSKKEKTFMKLATDEQYESIISFATGILKNYFAEMLIIAKYLKGKKYTFTNKVSESNVFIKYDEYEEDGSLKECMRLKCANTNIEEGRKMQIFDFKSFVEYIGLNVDRIFELPFPTTADFSKNDNLKHKDRRRSHKTIEYKESDGGISLGDLLKAKGYKI